MAKISNDLPVAINGLTVDFFDLPDFLVPIRGTARPKNASQPTIDGRSVVIENMRIPRKKKVAIRIRARVPQCHPAGPASVEAVAFILDENEGELLCLTRPPPLQLQAVASKGQGPSRLWLLSQLHFPHYYGVYTSEDGERTSYCCPFSVAGPTLRRDTSCDLLKIIVRVKCPRVTSRTSLPATTTRAPPSSPRPMQLFISLRELLKLADYSL